MGSCTYLACFAISLNSSGFNLFKVGASYYFCPGPLKLTVEPLPWPPVELIIDFNVCSPAPFSKNILHAKRVLTEWSKIHVHPWLLWSYLHVLKPVTTAVHVHKRSGSADMLRRSLFLFLICGVILQENFSEVELALLSNLSHVRVETEHYVLETEDGQGASLVIEGSLCLLEGYLVQGFQVLPHITVLLLYENLLFARYIWEVGSYLESLGNTQKWFTGNFEGDWRQKPPLALVLNKACLTFSLA